uniref:Rho guanine nucleotide exchange factor 6/7 coiled-coil domain-containing protein n=1 Tax=Timema genevievae TaxID=629358 RepID=A0A7R9JTZ8_TIMGE|nr:unnamed protein product [Timema genevievae]
MVNAVGMRYLRNVCEKTLMDRVSNEWVLKDCGLKGNPIAALLDSPQLLIAEEEKIIVEETTDNQIIVEEKSLVDTVYALKDQVKELQVNTVLISQQLEEEKRARSTLQGIVRTHVVIAGHEDIQWPPQIDS